MPPPASYHPSVGEPKRLPSPEVHPRKFQEVLVILMPDPSLVGKPPPSPQSQEVLQALVRVTRVGQSAGVVRMVGGKLTSAPLDLQPKGWLRRRPQPIVRARLAEEPFVSVPVLLWPVPVVVVAELPQKQKTQPD